MKLVVTGVTAALLGTAVARRVVVQAMVEGTSMTPTLQPGDRVLGVRVPWHPRIGNIVLLRNPLGHKPSILVKRVVGITSRGTFLIDGDGPVSLSSTQVGPIPAADLQAIVIGAFRHHTTQRVSFTLMLGLHRTPVARTREVSADDGVIERMLGGDQIARSASPRSQGHSS